MKTRTLLVGLLVAATIVAAPVAAQDNTTNTTTTAQTPENTSLEDSQRIQVDEHLTITAYEYHDEKIIIKIKSDRPRLVTVTDLGAAVVEGGGSTELTWRRLTVPRGTSEIHVDATLQDGKATVTVATADGGVALTEQVNDPIIGGEYTAGNTRTVGLTATAVTLVMVALLYLRQKQEETDTAEQVI